MTASRKRAHAGDEQLRWVAVARVVGNDGVQFIERVALFAFHDGVQEAREIGEVVVDDGAGHARGTRDRLDRHATVALLDDHAQGRIDQLLATLRGWHPRRVGPPRPWRDISLVGARR